MSKSHGKLRKRKSRKRTDFEVWTKHLKARSDALDRESGRTTSISSRWERAKDRRPFIKILKESGSPNVRAVTPSSIRENGKYAEYNAGEHLVQIDADLLGTQYPSIVLLHELAHVRRPVDNPDTIELAHSGEWEQEFKDLLDVFHPGVLPEGFDLMRDRPEGLCSPDGCSHFSPREPRKTRAIRMKGL